MLSGSNVAPGQAITDDKEPRWHVEKPRRTGCSTGVSLRAEGSGDSSNGDLFGRKGNDMRLTRTLLVIGILCSNIPRVDADPVRVADVAADFSLMSNPNGVWRYGWSETLGSPFILSTSPAVRGGVLDTWSGNIAADGNPAVYHNNTSSVVVLVGSVRFEPDQFGLHPGPNGEYAVARYVAPAAGDVSIRSVFASQDLFMTTTDVHVLLNGASVFDDFIEGTAGTSTVSFSRSFSLDPGDTVDFSVGFGRNGSFGNDSTALAATVGPVSPTPEPTTLLLVGVGALTIVSRRKRGPQPA